MARTTIVFGVLLILLGLGFFVGTGAAHVDGADPGGVRRRCCCSWVCWPPGMPGECTPCTWSRW